MPGQLHARRDSAAAAAATPGAEVVLERVRRVRGSVVAVADVSLRIASGEYVALTGPSGSGKSTLLSVIGGLTRPDGGRVLVDGHEPADHPGGLAGFHRDVVGFVFQMHHLLPMLTAVGNVEVPMIAAHRSRSERRRRAIDLLDEVGLTDRTSHLPAEMSGGERQRVAVARALANEPRLLLADEPTGALDSENSQRVLDLLEGARSRRGTTLMVVTHDPRVADRADRILYMLDGRLVEAPGS
ncbi:MAG TPA: ABC transporter ATP-binding protein [Solirubrobacteraceae bacterium]|jgi:putative ABC transport system ATP-binding protein|nr:ABC transporter ATP-binding protein [Solirubrobacteraceae bacterium]